MRKKIVRQGLNPSEPGGPASRAALSADAKRRLRKVLLWILAGAVVVSFVFFDSHSLLKRMTWRSEYLDVREENEQLRTDIAELEKEVSEGLSDEAVEKIAREEYGMRRPGETVYRVATPDEDDEDDEDEEDDPENPPESEARATDERPDEDE